MLVLSRRPHEKVLLPSLDISIQVLAVKAGLVRLGIEAPTSISICREEILDQKAVDRPVPPPDPLRQLNHLVRNRLNSTTIGLALLRRQLQQGLNSAAGNTLEKVEQEVRVLQEQIRNLIEENIATRPAPRRPPQRRALLVEDDRNECELLAGFLRLAGLEVDTASDGADALDYLRKGSRPDVLLLDMVLPKMDGPSTLRAIRQDPAYADLKIFAVSGRTPAQLGLDGQGIDRWFRKPLDPEVLLKELNQELSAPS